RAPLLRDAVRAAAASYDVMHIHGLWHLPAWHAARAARAARVPYVVSPRGMLEPEALAIRHARKAVAFRLLERRNLSAAAFLHATSTREAETLQRCGLGPSIVLAPNGVDVDRVSAPEPREVLARYGIGSGERFILFVGRIHPIKRLDLLAAAAARLRA